MNCVICSKDITLQDYLVPLEIEDRPSGKLYQGYICNGCKDNIIGRE